MRSLLGRQARANELGHFHAELERDPAFAADVANYGSIFTRDWTWQYLFDAVASAVKQRLFELDALAPDLMELYYYWKEVAPESKAALKAAQLLLSKIPGLLTSTFLAFELAADRIELQQGYASESEDGDPADNDERNWVEWGTDDDDEVQVPEEPAAPEAQVPEAPAEPEAPAATIEDGDDTEDDDDIILVRDTAAPAELVAAPELTLVQEELALVPAEAESDSLGGTPSALLVSTSKIRNVLGLASKLERECLSTCENTAKLSECMGLLSGNGTKEERATAFAAALCPGSADVFEAVQAALTDSPAAFISQLYVDIKHAHLHSMECIASQDPEGFDKNQRLEFEKSVRGKVVSELNCIELELVICTRTEAATPNPALRTRIEDLKVRRSSMVYQLSFVNGNIAIYSAPLQPMSVAAALELLALSPSVIRSDAPDEATHAVAAAYRNALLSCHPNTTRLATVDEDTRAICVAKCVSIGAAKDVLLAQIDLLEAVRAAHREAELKVAEAVRAAHRETELKRKRPLDSLDSLDSEPQDSLDSEPQDGCFGDENASDELPRKAARR